MANKRQEFCFVCGRKKAEASRLLKGKVGYVGT